MVVNHIIVANKRNPVKPFSVSMVFDNGQKFPMRGDFETEAAAQKKVDKLNKKLAAG